MPVYKTACPRNCYSTCSMLVTVEDGKIKFIEGNPENRATGEGICLKGVAHIEKAYSEKRILTPLLRKEGTEKFVKISWEKAFNILVSKLNYYKDNFGCKSIFYYTGSGTKGILNEVGMKFWKIFGGCTITHGDLCWPAGLEATRLTLGENKHNAPWDIENAKLIIIWGKNPAETNIHQLNHINNARDKGAKLVVIDPRRTETSERADLLIQPKPGTDAVLALTISNLLIQNNKIDKDFISKYVKGYDEFALSIDKFTVEYCSQITDIPVEFIEKLAELISENNPVTINAGFGMQRYSNGGQTMRSLIAILAITGNIGKKGAGWVYANLQSHIFNKIKDPIGFYPNCKPDDIFRDSISMGCLASDLQNTSYPPIKLMWVERGNPVTQNPNTEKIIKALHQIDYMVVVEQYMTDTARQADLVLPAKTMFEQTDVINAYWHSYIQLKRKVIEPPGEVKPETEIYYELAKKLGIEDDLISENLPAPGEEAIEEYLKNRIAGISSTLWDDLQNGPVLSPDFEEIVFEDLKFRTPSGKIEIFSEEAADKWNTNPLPEYVQIHEIPVNDDSDYLFLLTPNTKNRIHSQFNNLNIIREISSEPVVNIHPADAEKRGIKDSNYARVFNNRGEMLVLAKYDCGIKIGCVSITNGWWIKDGGSVNQLSIDRTTDMGFGAAFHDNIVKVERA